MPANCEWNSRMPRSLPRLARRPILSPCAYAQLRIDHGWCLGFLRCLMTSKCLQHLVATQRFPCSSEERLNGQSYSSFPVDQSAITVETQYLEISELHISANSMVASLALPNTALPVR